MSTRKIYKAVERTPTDVPLNEVMINGSLDLYEDVLKKNYFALSLKGNKLVLTAGNYIGLIPINSRVALLIEPKVSRDNWLYIVGKARSYLQELAYLREYSRKENSSESIIEFLSRAFLWQLTAVEEQGIYRQYQAKRDVTSFPRGKILFGESIRKAWSRGHTQSVSVEYYNFSKDTAHNRLLKYALDLSIEYLFSSSKQPNLGIRLRDLEDLFKQIPLDSTLTYLPEVQLTLERNSIPETRAYYDEVCRTALLIVEQSGLLPTLKGSEVTLSFVANMESAFQSYCFNVLKEHAQVLGENITVEQEPNGSKPLFTGPNCDSRQAEPDIVIQNSTGPLLLVEVKYKNKPSREDINQVITYATAYNHENIVLLCYADTKAQTGWIFVGRIGNKTNIWIYRVNLESIKIEDEERIFAESMGKMLRGEIRL